MVNIWRTALVMFSVELTVHTVQKPCDEPHNLKFWLQTKNQIHNFWVIYLN